MYQVFKELIILRENKTIKNKLKNQFFCEIDEVRKEKKGYKKETYEFVTEYYSQKKERKRPRGVKASL